MLCGCIVTKLKSTFDSLVCEFTAKAGIVSKCRCNIFTSENRAIDHLFCFSAPSIRKFFVFSALKPVHSECEACLPLMHWPSFKSIASAHDTQTKFHRKMSFKLLCGWNNTESLV